MKATLDCLACIAAQALRAARVSTDDPALQRRILDETVRRIPPMDLDRSPAELSLAAYTIAADVSGERDPYRALKRAQNDAALRMEPELRALLDASEDRLVAALHLSAAGNIIDLGVQHDSAIDIRAAIEQVMRRRFAVDHTEAFFESLSRCRDLLFLLDNAGEIVFDKLLIEELLERTSVTAVVKAGPIINDAMFEDAEQVGLTGLAVGNRRCEVIDNGGAFVGSPMGLVPPAFLERLRRADMIVGKGQGNYETIDDFPGNVFLVLRAKCETIAAHMGVEYGEVALISTRVRRNLENPVR